MLYKCFLEYLYMNTLENRIWFHQLSEDILLLFCFSFSFSLPTQTPFLHPHHVPPAVHPHKHNTLSVTFLKRKTGRGVLTHNLLSCASLVIFGTINLMSFLYVKHQSWTVTSKLLLNWIFSVTSLFILWL